MSRWHVSALVVWAWLTVVLPIAANPLIGNSAVPPGLADWPQLRADVRAGKLAVDDNGVPLQLDASLDRPSKNGLYRVSIRSEANPPPMNAIHDWSIRILTAEGRPVRGAAVRIFGGMPLHDHGFPTQPAVEETGDGEYRLRGMKLHMPGWWQLILVITHAESTDAVTFDVALRPGE